MTSQIALCLLLVFVGLSNAQFFNRGFFSSVVDEPNYRQENQHAYVSPEERIRELDEKLSARISQQVTLMRERIEQLEKQVREFRRSNVYDWHRSDSGSLYKIFTVPKNWDEAQSVCNSFNAHLAVIDTEHKNAFVRALLQKQFGDSENVADAWIGLKTKAEMTTSDSSYSNFSDSEKVDGCTVIDREGKWQVKACSLQRIFICQQINVR